MSCQKFGPILTNAALQSAREVITSHYDAQVRAAEDLLANAEQAVQSAHAARAAWIDSHTLDEVEAAHILGAACNAYAEAATDYVEGKNPDPDAVARLRRERDLVRAYVRDELGHKTIGETP